MKIAAGVLAFVVGFLGVRVAANMLNRQNRPAVTPTKSNPVLILSKANTLVLNGTVTENSMAVLTSQLLKMSHELPSNQVINLVMYTPGGEVSAGSSFIDAANAIPQKISTLSIFSASMGFHIVQHASGMRYILPSGTLMSHRAKGGVEGEFHGSINSRLSWIYQQLEALEKITSARMGLSLPSYRAAIKDEFWVSGDTAVEVNAADQVVTATCDKSLAGTAEQTVQTMFGPVNLTMSACPLITSPLGFKFAVNDKNKLGEVTNYFDTLYNDPAQFIVDYIETEKYKNIVK